MQKSSITLQFLGAANTVTGSRFLLSCGQQHILIDCGMFQGYKNLRERNWRPFPIPVDSIDAIVLTHAHMDHSGFVPALVREGFRGKVYCTDATAALCEILWLDAAHLQTEEAEYQNRHHLSKHHPARPLYDEDDARNALKRLQVVPLKQPLELDNVTIRFHRNGHILGSCFLEVVTAGKTLLFSGDLGRPHDLIMRPPQPAVYADYLIVESTYGNRLHDTSDVATRIANIINETAHRGGSVLIPAFAVGRAQSILYLLAKLADEQKIPPLPIYLDSPMAISVTDIYRRFTHYHKLHGEECELLSRAHCTRTVQQSQGLNSIAMPHIIVSASGMATGGRVLHHLKYMLDKAENTILFTGFQAGGTRGARLVNGEPFVKIHGEYIPVKARIENIDNLSAHADYSEAMTWLENLAVAPTRTFVVHGEPEAADAMRLRINETYGWSTCVPEQGDVFQL